MQHFCSEPIKLDREKREGVMDFYYETKKDLIKLTTMVDEGCSTSKIAKRFGCVKSFIEEKVRRNKLHGIEGMLHKEESYKFTPEFKMEIINRYYAGESKNSLAIEINVSHSVVYSWIKKN